MVELTHDLSKVVVRDLWLLEDVGEFGLDFFHLVGRQLYSEIAAIKIPPQNFLAEIPVALTCFEELAVGDSRVFASVP